MFKPFGDTPLARPTYRVLIPYRNHTQALRKLDADEYIDVKVYRIDNVDCSELYFGVQVAVTQGILHGGQTDIILNVLFNLGDLVSRFLKSISKLLNLTALEPLATEISSFRCSYRAVDSSWSFDKEWVPSTVGCVSTMATPSVASKLTKIQSLLPTLPATEYLEEGNFMDQITEAEQQDKMDITTTEKEEYKQEYLTIKNFMELRYEEIYGRRPEPSDTNKIIADVNALTNTQIMKGDYEWWALTQVAHYHYHVPLLKFSRTVSSNGTINISELHESVVADLIHLYGAERVLGMSTATHRLGIIVKR